jgi:hypothetical protein
MESWELGDERAEVPPAVPAGEVKRGWSVAAVIGGILAAVLIIGGLFVVGVFVLFAIGLSRWGSNK